MRLQILALSAAAPRLAARFPTVGGCQKTPCGCESFQAEISATESLSLSAPTGLLPSQATLSLGARNRVRGSAHETMGETTQKNHEKI